ncbi:MAG: hypothetical protein WA869_11445 [Alloacidobacterium sp.]
MALRSSRVNFPSATARAFAKFTALVNRLRSPSNGFTSASSLTNWAAAALGPKPHHFPASSSEFSSEYVVKRRILCATLCALIAVAATRMHAQEVVSICQVGGNRHLGDVIATERLLADSQ